MEATIGTKNLLAHADFAVPPLHIPDGKGGCYKTELVLERSKERVVKIQWWHAPDPRRDPHNHPWMDSDGIAFRSTILAGGYTETRWKISGDWVRESRHEYREGEVNIMPYNVYHTVDEVLSGTVTRMVTGPVAKGKDWGYLIDGAYVSALDDPYPNMDFFAQLCELNPHKRPA